MYQKKVATIVVACLATISFSSCKGGFDYEMKSETVVGERVSSSQEWDDAFTAANDLAEKEGFRRMSTGYVVYGRSFLNGLFQEKYVERFASEVVSEGRSQGKLFYSSCYESKYYPWNTVDTAYTEKGYRMLKDGRVIDITLLEDGAYRGRDIGTDIFAGFGIYAEGWDMSLQEDTSESQTIFSDEEISVWGYENASYSTAENAYCISYNSEDDGAVYESKGDWEIKYWVWIVYGVVKKIRLEGSEMIKDEPKSDGTSFVERRACAEIYFGGMNGTVEIPEYTLDGTI